MKRVKFEIPPPRKLLLSPYVQRLAITEAYPFTTGSGAQARKRPNNGKGQTRGRGRFVREAV